MRFVEGTVAAYWAYQSKDGFTRCMSKHILEAGLAHIVIVSTDEDAWDTESSRPFVILTQRNGTFTLALAHPVPYFYLCLEKERQRLMATTSTIVAAVVVAILLMLGAAYLYVTYGSTTVGGVRFYQKPGSYFINPLCNGKQCRPGESPNPDPWLYAGTKTGLQGCMDKVTSLGASNVGAWDVRGSGDCHIFSQQSYNAGNLQFAPDGQYSNSAAYGRNRF